MCIFFQHVLRPIPEFFIKPVGVLWMESNSCPHTEFSRGVGDAEMNETIVQMRINKIGHYTATLHGDTYSIIYCILLEQINSMMVQQSVKVTVCVRITLQGAGF